MLLRFIVMWLKSSGEWMKGRSKMLRLLFSLAVNVDGGRRSTARMAQLCVVADEDIDMTFLVVIGVRSEQAE